MDLGSSPGRSYPPSSVYWRQKWNGGRWATGGACTHKGLGLYQVGTRSPKEKVYCSDLNPTPTDLVKRFGLLGVMVRVPVEATICNKCLSKILNSILTYRAVNLVSHDSQRVVQGRMT